MTTLQIKTTIPDDRHITLDLSLPETVQPGDADILLMIKNKKENKLSTKKSCSKNSTMAQSGLMKISQVSENSERKSINGSQTSFSRYQCFH